MSSYKNNNKEGKRDDEKKTKRLMSSNNKIDGGAKSRLQFTHPTIIKDTLYSFLPNT